MSTIVGIDPGAQTGIAIYHGGKLIALRTITPWNLPDELRNSLRGASRIVFEDSRLQKVVFSRDVPGKPKMRPEVKLKIARDVGRIDAWSSLITEVCAELKIPAHGISPKGKGAKEKDAEQFTARTGWKGRCNQHERDAAMVAWPYRGAVKSAA